MQDEQIIQGLLNNDEQRPLFEKALYMQYNYYIEEGCKKYRLHYDESSSAYSDAVLSVILNILKGSFQQNATLKTYLFQIFSNKCIDLIRKKTTDKYKVHHSVLEPELLAYLPTQARNALEKLIDLQKMNTIKQHLETIGEKCKQILLLFEDGYNDKEIADQMAYSNAAVVKTTRLRCLEKMRSLLGQYERNT